MTKPREEVYDAEVSGFYHCISRCVRQAFLCGFDKYTSKCYEHRKGWIRERLSELLEIFAIECLAYAIMSNHLHSLLHNRPDIAASWSPQEVARRWRLLFPRRRTIDGKPEAPNEEEIEEIVSQPVLVLEYRERLSNLSWFNRCLNENIACRSNAEDGCKGRFWQGRFKCIALKNSAAVLACSVYIDLNPIRAGVAKTPEHSDYTSIQDRILSLLELPKDSAPTLISHPDYIDGGPQTHEYIELVEETGKIILQGKGSIPKHLEPILVRLGINAAGWIENCKNQSRIFKRIIGSVSDIRKRAADKGKHWFQGLAAARLIFA